MPPRPRLTHFLCIPLVTAGSRPQLLSSLSSFRADVAAARSSPSSSDVAVGIPDAAIRPLGTLHLTLGVMALETPERVREALGVLRGLDLRALLLLGVDGDGGDGRRPRGGDAGLRITLRGLESMHAPSRTSILYSSPSDAGGRLYPFCSAVRRRFVDAGLVVGAERPLLLHATVVNTIYVPGVRGGGEGHGIANARLVVDARGILEDYRDVEWMSDVRVEKIAICRMGAQRNEHGDEVYVVEGEVDMPV